MIKAVFLGFLITATTLPTTLRADPITIDVATLSRFALLTNTNRFGALEWRGGLELSSADSDFGGLSGLAMAEDCSSVSAIGDRGRLFTADLTYDAGKLSGVRNGQTGRLRDAKGKKLEGKSESDAEGLANVGNGKTAVAFERGGRIGVYNFKQLGFKAPYVDANAPKEIAKGPFNGQLESIGYFSAGQNVGKYFAIAESNFDAAGNTRAWIWNDNSSIALSVERFGDYLTTDVVTAPNGDMFFLERNIGVISLPATAIRYLPSHTIQSGETLKPQVIFEASMPFYTIDNMEGLGFCTMNGEPRLTLVSDNNFNTILQRTLLLQFAIQR